jgi:hypothetical protein
MSKSLTHDKLVTHCANEESTRAGSGIPDDEQRSQLSTINQSLMTSQATTLTSGATAGYIKTASIDRDVPKNIYCQTFDKKSALSKSMTAHPRSRQSFTDSEILATLCLARLAKRRNTGFTTLTKTVQDCIPGDDKQNCQPNVS